MGPRHCWRVWGLNSKQENNIWGTIWSFSLELLNLDPGGKRGLLCYYHLSFSSSFFVWAPTISLKKICFWLSVLSVCPFVSTACFFVSPASQFTLAAFSAWGLSPLTSQCFLSPIMLFCLSSSSLSRLLSDGDGSFSQSLSSLYHLALI